MSNKEKSHCHECGYTQEDAETHVDHNLCSNKNPPWRKYFRSQIHPGDSRTMVYWIEYEDGKKVDIADNRIQDGAIVTDITYEEINVIKKGRTFECASIQHEV